MPAISKIRLTNVVYEEGNKRYNDELFLFEGYNGAILLENGGGKTVFIQTVLQAIIPHTDLADRKIKNTLVLENAPAHIAVEWKINENPSRYVVTAVTLFMTKDGLDSFRYVYEYGHGDDNGIDGIPFVRSGKDGLRPAERGEIQDYYSYMKERSPLYARTFSTIKDYRKFIEEQYHINAEAWESVVKINSSEGGVEAFFEACKNTNQLFDRLLIPIVENSITGHDPQIFADMFEKQHDSLKQYKKLKETIEENKRIQAELEKYVQTFEKLHLSQKEYEGSRQKAKGIWEELQIQKTENLAQLENLESELQEWNLKQRLYNVKEASFEIERKKQKFEHLQKEFNIANAEYTSKREQLDNLNADYYSFSLAKLKQELLEYENEIAFAESELEKLHETEDLYELEDQLEEAKQELLGSYIERMEKIKAEITDIQYELNPIIEQIKELQKELETNETVKQTKQQDISSIRSKIQTRKADMRKLEQQLLSAPEQEQVLTKMKDWERRHQYLDEEIIRINNEKNTNVKEQKELDQTIEELKESKYKLDHKLLDNQSKKEQFDTEQTEVIKKLGLLRPQWVTIESVYNSEKSILNRLIETLDKLNDDKNKLLFKERVAYRLVDDYQDQNSFFSDPIIESRLKTWKNQLDYCVTGIEYIQMLDEADYESKQAYPLWAVTLITTKRSKPILQEKIAEVSNELRYPIQIMTTEEAAEITAETNDQDYAWMIPSHWNKGMMNETFELWKQEIYAEAKIAKSNREIKEKEINQWDKTLLAFQEFIGKYPFEEVTALENEQLEINIKIDQILRDINKHIERKEDLQRLLKQMEEAAADYYDEKQGLEWKIDKCVEYVRYSQEVKEAEEIEARLNKELEAIHTKLNRIGNLLAGFKYDKESLLDRKRNLEASLRALENEEDYKEVRGLTPKFTQESKKIIQDKIRSLEMKINKISTGYETLKVRLNNAQNNKKRVMHNIEQLRTDQEYLDENLDFPSDGEELLKALNEKIKQSKAEIKDLEKLASDKKSDKDKQEGILNDSIERFSKDFPDVEVFTFTDSLEQIKISLKLEKENLLNEKRYLDGQSQQVKQQLNFIDAAERSLDKYNVKHHFNVLQIEPIHLSSDEKMEFSYNREKLVQAIILELEEKFKQVEIEEHQVGRQKHLFKQFCLTISDIKLRKMAENGIEFKQNYDDLLDFKKNMMKSVERATSYANEHIRKKDEELQAYINQIHAHIKTVVEELKQIPKNTRIKSDGSWKTIYDFKIPEWEEEDGKQRIRDHIEWIMVQLESDRYLREDGNQDEVKIRKDLEMWLQTKQLLQIVMKNEMMKVNCRKVTNENKVTTRSYSWEQSNVWSGGEKWSKNMTLFLGLLNYVSEKKHHKQANIKHSRAVILDNPFGKASSDHVLNPVFFVAEQLGFQIIALTAHAEGKFLQDYFPILYSCRLRDSKQSNKQVITKEKWLHSAYFKDHEPETLEKLTEVEQISFF